MAESVATRLRTTRAEYQMLPEGPPYYELIDGELVEMTRPVRAHYRIVTFLIELLGPHIRRSRGELAPEPNLYLPGIEDVYHPDLVYVARDRRNICREDGIRGVPTMVCEVLSSSTVRTDRRVKLETYRGAGVPSVWLIDPRLPVAVEEYVLQEDGRYRLHANLTAPAEWEPVAFPGWRLPLSQLEAVAAPVEDETP
jgi:Uma2 family endonuclease